MRHPLRVIALGLALAATPACASLKLGGTTVENPISAARTLDQRAYALIQTYAAVLEEAGNVVRDPAVPLSVKRTLGSAERVATPAVQTLEIAVATYVRTQADYQAAISADASTLARASAALTIAGQRLTAAIAAAQTPISQLQAALN